MLRDFRPLFYLVKKNLPGSTVSDPHKFHADPDPEPGSQKCTYRSGSEPLNCYSDPDPKGVKFKKTTYTYQQIFNKFFQNDIKTPLKISKHKVLQKGPYFYVSSSVFT